MSKSAFIQFDRNKLHAGFDNVYPMKLSCSTSTFVACCLEAVPSGNNDEVKLRGGIDEGVVHASLLAIIEGVTQSWNDDIIA